MSAAPRKYDTAPARMRSKREVAATWDITQAAQFFAPPVTGSGGAAAGQEAVHAPGRAATLSGVPTYAAGSSAEWNGQGSGSWGRVSKRKTSEENAMSLWEVSEALKTAVAPPAEAMLADAGASPESSADVIGMGLLDALVALEETEQLAGRRAPPSASPPATGTPSETECAEGDAPILDPDELLAMLHPDAQMFERGGAPALPEMPPLSADGRFRSEPHWAPAALEDEDDEAAARIVGDDPFAAIGIDDGPSSPSPTSVATLFGEALSGISGTPPAGASVAMDWLGPEALSARVSAKLGGHASAPQQRKGSPARGPSPPGGGKGDGASAAGKGGKGAPLEGIAAQFATPSNGSPSSRNGAERKEWTATEDETIRNAMAQHGARWRKIAAMLPGRSDDAVRNRWNRLKDLQPGEMPTAPLAPPPPIARRTSSAMSDGGVKPERVSWTKAEDATIIQSVAELGHKWNKLAERLPGRTDHAIRNRFHRLQTMMEDKQRAQQRFFAPAEPLPSVPTTPLVGLA